MTESAINTINTLFALGTMGFIALSIFLTIGLLTKDKGKIFAFLAKNGLKIVFLVSSAGVLGSLIYQYIIGFAPCMLCWYQRIVLYPIAIISFVAMIRKHADRHVLSYSLVLGIIGFLLAVYHNFEKIIGKELVECSAYGVSCLQTYVQKFGFIDIPVMSLTFFILIILLIANQRRFVSIKAE